MGGILINRTVIILFLYDLYVFLSFPLLYLPTKYLTRRDRIHTSMSLPSEYDRRSLSTSSLTETDLDLDSCRIGEELLIRLKTMYDIG